MEIFMGLKHMLAGSFSTGKQRGVGDEDWLLLVTLWGEEKLQEKEPTEEEGIKGQWQHMPKCLGTQSLWWIALVVK